MNELFESYTELLDFIKDNIPPEYTRTSRPTKTNPTPHVPNSPASDGQKEHAAKVIQRIWRSHRIKKSLLSNPYNAYMSLMDDHDEKAQLAALLYGRHEAELSNSSRYKINNPFIIKHAAYYRCDFPDGVIFKAFRKQFNLSDKQWHMNLYTPVCLSKTLSIEVALEPLKQGVDYNILTIDNAVGLIEFTKSKGEGYCKLRQQGLIATPWALAEQVKTEDLPEALRYKKQISSISSPSDKELPSTKADFEASNILKILKRTANNRKLPTQKLALCLQKLLKELPNLDPETYKRIALMIDVANNFYTYNYPRYALSVYTIIHEISLVLSKEKDPVDLERSFLAFETETKETFKKSFGLLDSDLDNSTLVAGAALSGTNACAIAHNLAKKMHTDDDKAPLIKTIEPYYYEFSDYETTNSDDADIFLFSTGPIVGTDGLTPGVDINLFIKRNIIDRNRTKPVTLIVDATTTLYKNLKLNDEAKKLVQDGTLSILVIESHQKFGLLHTDQAQHGRFFGICAKQSYAQALVEQVQANAKEDFNSFLDMRIGGYISTWCSETLEEIKQQHFTNGALLRNILIQTQLSSDQVVTHENMLTNLEELCFSTIMDHLDHGNLFESRNSFGHFIATQSGVGHQSRVSPGASDIIDNLILSSQIYLATKSSPSTLKSAILLHLTDKTPLRLEQQIVCLAIMNQFSSFYNENPRLIKGDLHMLWSATSILLEKTESLRGRPEYSRMVQFNDYFKRLILSKDNAEQNVEYLGAIKVLYRHHVTVDDSILKALSNSENLCKAVKLFESTFQPEWFQSLATNPKLRTEIIKGKEQLQECLNLLEQLKARDIVLDLERVPELMASADSRTALQIILDSNLALERTAISGLMEPKVAKYIIEHKDSLAQTQVRALAALGMINKRQEDFTLLDNDNFCKAAELLLRGTEDILSNLKTAPSKYKTTIQYANPYLKASLTAVADFYSKKAPDQMDRNELFTKLDHHKDEFCDKALSIDRTFFSGAARIILALVVNIISGLALSLPFIVHHRLNNRFLFFTQTNSEKKSDSMLENLHDLVVNTDKKKP